MAHFAVLFYRYGNRIRGKAHGKLLELYIRKRNIDIIFVVAYIVSYKKNDIGIAIVFHCLCNLFSSVSFILSIFHEYTINSPFPQIR